MAALTHSIPRDQIVGAIGKLIDNLVNITDETGEFLLRLDDGRVIDTKGWAGWEWTHGVVLFGLYRYWEQTVDQKAFASMLKWFADRVAEG
ncbi:MAG: glycoside hydrolase family 88 protein, partial [Sphingomonas sp.]